jgi:predicted KAP-like P-loop ATPase
MSAQVSQPTITVKRLRLENIVGNGVRFWDDNPAATDLLGFRSVVEPVAAAVRSTHLDPLTVGIHAPWGAGKTSVLTLLASELRSDADLVVVEVSPWEFDHHADVRGELIGAVLGEMDSALGESFRERIRSLLGRIGWVRAGTLIATGATTGHLDLAGLVDALTPSLPESDKRTMREFRSEFNELLKKAREDEGIEQVVVLVDDLDRCLPEAVVQTFEAIRLFMSVPGMTFVLAADIAMVQKAVATRLQLVDETDAFARRYVEKIVQLPVSLPKLLRADAVAYMAQLLAKRHLTDENAERFVRHCSDRRGQQSPSLVTEMEDSPAGLEDHIRLAEQVVYGMTTAHFSNPREIKRFLNALGVRQQLAASRGVELERDVLAKLFMLEAQYPRDFEVLARQSSSERPDFLAAWEKWARSESDDAPDNSSLLKDLTPASRQWAGSEPSLSDVDVDLDRYLTFATAFADGEPAATKLSKAASEARRELLSKSAALRNQAHTSSFPALTEEEQVALLESLFDLIGSSQHTGRVLTELIRLVDEQERHSHWVVERLLKDHRQHFKATHIQHVSGLQSSEAKRLAEALPDSAAQSSPSRSSRSNKGRR